VEIWKLGKVVVFVYPISVFPNYQITTMSEKAIIVKDLSKSYNISAVKSIWSKATRLFKKRRSDNPGHDDKTFWALGWQ